MAALHRLCQTGSSDVPVYDIPGSRRTGWVRLVLQGAPLVIAEGIFAAELTGACRRAGLLGEAICLGSNPAVTFVRRLARDLAEHRKPPRCSRPVRRRSARSVRSRSAARTSS